MRLFRTFVVVLWMSCVAHSQDVWFRFDKGFVTSHIDAVTGFGSITANEAHPSAVHPASCGGKDGEVHVGVLEDDIVWTNPQGTSSSGLGDGSEDQWGIVVEPVNLVSGQKAKIDTVAQARAVYSGYFRVWNEGHYQGVFHESNPHHVMELHPAWGYDGSGEVSNRPSSIRPMPGYAGYGASKFKPLLRSIVDDDCLQTYEDDDSVYIQIRKADNFYQLPVIVRQISTVGAARHAVVDVYSNANHTNLVFKGLAVNMLSNAWSNALSVGKKTFFLGLFSVNPRRAMELAAGHHGESEATSAVSALEFFAFGRPSEHAVKNGQCEEE